MARKFERPKHPNTDRVDPFSDASGNNPFSGENSEGETDEDIFAPPTAAPMREPSADDFETTAPHRGRLVFWTGVVGLAMTFAGAIGVTAVTANDFGWDGNTSLASLAPLSMFGLLPALIALFLGRQDAYGIRVGALDPAGRQLVTRGWMLGAVGTLAGVGASAIYIYRMIVLSN